jgi:hypothetical protein
MRVWIKLTAVLLLVAWFPASSHAWLETAGLIHSARDAHQETNHEAANGHCQLAHGDLTVKIPMNSAQPWLAVIIATVPVIAVPAAFVSVPPLGSTAPPELSRTWQFAERTALPGRAPSFAV